MIIQSSAMSLYGSRTYMKRSEETESLKTWAGGRRPNFEGAREGARRNTPAARIADSVELSQQAKCTRSADNTAATAGGDRSLSKKDGLRVLLIERFMQALTGKRFKIRLPGETPAATGQAGSCNAAAQHQAGGQAGRPAQGWGLEYDYHKFEYESEVTTFRASGMIKTLDGKEINFSVEMNMSREFLAEQNVSVRAGDAVSIDPLVINFGGSAPALTATKFAFDLNADGAEDQVSFLAPGAGFLSLDSNGNGTIDDGKELFGPETGSGFAELSAFDEDGNGWIDEGDQIFSRLRIWTKDAEGSDVLTGLAEKGIGAIFLGRVSTPFNINADDNTPLGSVKESGIYLNENGTAGTVQEIDLTA